MELVLSLAIVFALVSDGKCKSIYTSTTSTKPGFPSSAPRNATASTTKATTTQMGRVISTTSQPSHTTTDKLVLGHASPPDNWFGQNSSIPVIVLASLVLVLVLVVIVLSVIIVHNRRQMNQIKKQQSKPSSPQLPGSPQDPPSADINHNPSPAVLPAASPSFTPPLDDGQRNASLKYDQPYAHQKPITNMIRNIIHTNATNAKPTLEVVDFSSSENGSYLTPHEVDHALPDSRSSSLNHDDLLRSTSQSSEYQVPRNATKRAGLLAQEPHEKNATLKDDSDYVVMMSTGVPALTDDDKAKKSSKDSNKNAKKSTLRRIPENFAKSKIKFFQDRTKTDKCSRKTGQDDNAQYDVPKGIK